MLLSSTDAFEFQIMFADSKTIISAFVQNRGHDVHGRKMNDSNMYAGNDSSRLSSSNTKVTTIPMNDSGWAILNPAPG